MLGAVGKVDGAAKDVEHARVDVTAAERAERAVEVLRVRPAQVCDPVDAEIATYLQRFADGYLARGNSLPYLVAQGQGEAPSGALLQSTGAAGFVFDDQLLNASMEAMRAAAGNQSCMISTPFRAARVSASRR